MLRKNKVTNVAHISIVSTLNVQLFQNKHINHSGLFDMHLPIKKNAKIIIRYTFSDDIVFYGIHWNTSHRRCTKR